MTIDKENAQVWATAWEMAAFSFRYPDYETAGAIISGQWAAAAAEIIEVLGGKLPDDFGQLTVAEEARNNPDDVGTSGAFDGSADALVHVRRAEATRLFVNPPASECPPYEGVWRAKDEGVQPMLFVNPHSLEVERFCKACGLGRPAGTNEPLDHVVAECELMQFLAVTAGNSALPEECGIAIEELPGKSAEAAYGLFLADHVRAWMPCFAKKVVRESRVPFYADAAWYLLEILKLSK